MDDERGNELLILMGTAPVHAATFEMIASVTSPSGVGMCQTTSSSPSHTYARVGDLTSGEVVPMRHISNSSVDSGGTQEFPAMSTSLLNEMDRGDFARIPYDRIQHEYPEVWAERQQDPLHFRYPGVGGESYSDVIGRLRPIIIELERQRRSVLVISNLAVQRCLYAYFAGVPMAEVPHLVFDMHSVAELQPGPFGCKVTRTTLA